MFRKPQDDLVNKYIRERIRQARSEANESQDDLAKILEKSRVAVSDMERGRSAVSTADLATIAMHYEKPISFFFPPRISIDKSEISPLDEELLFLFNQLPSTQKHIGIEYVRQQVEISKKAYARQLTDEVIKIEGSE